MNEPTSQVDQQLLELVRRKPPEELTPEEIKRLQERLGESPALRQAMAGQLRMEEYLAAALGSVNLPVEEMMNRSDKSRSWSRVLTSPLGAIVAVLLLLGVLGLVVVAINRSGPAEVAQGTPEEEEAPAEETPREDDPAEPGDTTTPADVQNDPESQDTTDPASGDEGNSGDTSEEDPAPPVGEEDPTQTVSAEEKPELPPQDFHLVIEAEDFVQGNVLRDENEFGTADCVIARTDDAAGAPSFAEYEFEVPVGGQYELMLRYASFDSRPLKLTLNGQLLPGMLAEEPTGGWHQSEQRWRMQPMLELQPGGNLLRLEALTQFPNLDKLSITVPPRAGDDAPLLTETTRPSERPWEADLAVVPRSFEAVWFQDLTPDIQPPKTEEVGAWFDDANLPVLALMSERRRLMTDWEDQLNGVRVLTAVRIEGPPAEAGREIEFTQLEDGSYLVGGLNPKKGTYTLWFDEDLAGAESITLEAIGHEWLPNGGPGRSAGSALLTRFQIYQGPQAALTTEVGENGLPTADYRIAISGAEASHALTGYPIADCLDERTNSGWGLDPNQAVDHRARFELETPIAENSGWLRIDMHQDYGAEQMFGRFRFLVPSGELPEVPPQVREVLNIVPSSRTPEQMQVLVDYLAPRDPRLAVLSEQITQLSGEGSALNWELGDSPKGNTPRLQGIGRLRSPWFEDAVLRLEMLDYSELKIHFYHGDTGATLVYYGHGQLQWAGYETERMPGQSIPTSYVLTATDSYRNWRSGGIQGGPVDLRYSQGEIILSRGDIELLRVPLPGEPEEVYLDGSTTIAGIGMYRAADLPPAPPVGDIVAFDRPAELPWDESRLIEQVELKRNDDGSLSLSGEEVANAFRLSTAIPLLTPSEIVMEVSGVSPGMSLYITQGNQDPDAILNIVQEPGGGRNFAIAHAYGSARREDPPPDVNHQIAPFVGDRFWVKFALAGPATRCWLSVDGVHWGEWMFPLTRNSQPIDTVGIYYPGGGGNVSLTLHRVELRPLAGLAGLVNAEVLERANEERGANILDAWLAAADAECPADVEPAQWRKARALRILAKSTSIEQTQMLLGYLFDSAVEEGQPIETQLGILHDSSLITPPVTNSEEAVEFHQRYVDVGIQAHALGEQHPYTLIRRRLMSDPYVYTPQIGWGDERLQNWELIYPIYQGDWREVANVCKGWEFLHVDSGTQLTPWAIARAEENLAGGGGSLASFLRQEWLPPVSAEIDKTLYNQVVELETTVDSDAIEEACNQIRQLEPGASAGLAPTRTDSELYVSLQAAIALTMSRRPEVREAIQSQYEDIAALRVQAAARNGDFEALRLASLQFYGTQAALQASMRLGDRALSAGDFERAMSLYEQASEQAASALLGELNPRIRLTAALMGRNAGEPVLGHVSLGEASYSAEEFETLVSEMRGRNEDQAVPLSDTPTWRPVLPAPAPTGYSVQPRAVFDGPAGANIPNYSVPLGNQLQMPWVERQIATTLHDNVLYVNNRFQVSAFNVEDGTRIWQNSLPFGDHQFDMRPFTAMKPVLIPDQVVCRMLMGPRLIAMRQDNGQAVWNAAFSERALCSDPVIWHEKLYVLVRYADPNRPPRFTLALETYNPTNGGKLNSVELVSVWQSSMLSEVAQLTICGNRLVASYEGATICLDEEGRVIWLRQHTTMPESLERYWVLQDQQPVLYENGLLYATLPGMRKIECMELDSGRSRWRAVLADLRGVVGLSEGVLMARTETGFIGYDAETGEQLWRKDIDELCEGVLAGGPGGLLCARRISRLGESNLWPQLVWLDPLTGEERATFTLESLSGPAPQIGPIVNLGDRLWLFHAIDQTTIERQIYELTPDASLELSQLPAESTP